MAHWGLLRQKQTNEQSVAGKANMLMNNKPFHFPVHFLHLLALVS